MKHLLIYLFLFLSFVAQANAEGIKREAETAKYTKCDIVSDSKYSGKKAVRMTEEGAKLTFTIDISAIDKYTLFVAAEGIGGEKVVNCAVGGDKCQFKTNKYGEVEIGSFLLSAGSNEVVITPNWTWFAIDYIRLENNSKSVEFNISSAPVDANASQAAKVMYTFLFDNFGKKSISGMMLGDMSSYNGNVLQHADVKAVYNASGQNPALVGFDFMNATGKSETNTWNKDYTRSSVNLAKDIYRRGGIPAFTWHWRDPSRKTDAFYSSEASVKISSAMNADGSWNTSSSLYRYLIRDIDAVANYFLELQNANMACIFRPLHEASGKWFWWGNDGADSFRKLYRLVYDEMVNVKGVHNVIWVWNADPSDADWNPGSDYYDVVSADIYNESFDYSSNYVTFDKLKELTEGKKIIALSENGPIPDIQQEIDDEAVWSWWMPWYQTWDGGFVDKTSKEEWKKCMGSSNVITLSDMKGWDGATAIMPAIGEGKSNSQMYDLNGRPVAPHSAKGIVVINNKKIMVR